MFNSPIIEVAIGLAFIYLLLSLICSGLTELVAARLLSLLSSNLKKLIEQQPEGKESNTVCTQSDIKHFVNFRSVVFSTTIFGWLFTAFAVSFGAPFWFDMLNKLVKMRASGKKPKEEKDKTTT